MMKYQKPALPRRHRFPYFTDRAPLVDAYIDDYDMYIRGIYDNVTSGWLVLTNGRSPTREIEVYQRESTGAWVITRVCTSVGGVDAISDVDKLALEILKEKLAPEVKYGDALERMAI